MTAEAALRQTLAALGWRRSFEETLGAGPDVLVRVARVFAVQRTGLTLVGAGFETVLALGGRWFQLDTLERPTVGDWVVLDADRQQIETLLPRFSLLQRAAPGREAERQLIAANVDVLFLVTACNEEFNLSRLERYLSLAFEAGVQPVVVLTKVDQAEDPAVFVDAVRALPQTLPVHALDARDVEAVAPLAAYVGAGRTVALLGSSGVGKSTLVNTLSGQSVQLTGATREGDDKGRHTTTHRSLHRLPDGGLLLDSPGMRELQIADVESGVQETFEDVETLAARCRFNDCRHDAEPGCAVRAAMAAGELEPRRLANFLKLRREEQQTRTARARRRGPGRPR